MVLEDEPGKKIAVLDSESAAAGQTLIALTLRRLIDEELEFDEIERRIRAFIAPMRTRFVLEDLSNPHQERPHLQDGGLRGHDAQPASAHGRQRPRRDHVPREDPPARPTPCTALWSAWPRDGLRRAGQPHARAQLLQLPRARGGAEKDFLAKCRALREVVMVPTGGISTVYAFDGGVVIAF